MVGGHVYIVGLFWQHLVSILKILRSFGMFESKCQSETKNDLEASDGTHGSPRGFLRAQGCHFGRCWVRFRVIWGAKLEPKIGLGASGGPHGSPKGPQGAPWEPKGAILEDLGVILKSFLKPKSCQNR